MSIHETTSTDWDAFELPVVPPGRMTEDEFVAWNLRHDDLRAEWADGEVIIMSPVSFEHSDLNGWISAVLKSFVEYHDLGIVCGPEYPVRLAGQKRWRVPDLFFVSTERLDLAKTNHMEGSPDLAIEIVSPDSVARDWREKYLEYQTAGVREYWVIDPLNRRVEVYAVAATGEFQRLAEQDGKLVSRIVPGFYLRPAWLWQETRPKIIDALRELGVV